MERIELPITGMTCANCARTVERKLKKTEGVPEVNVNYATERASVNFDPAQVECRDDGRKRQQGGLWRGDRQH